MDRDVQPRLALDGHRRLGAADRADRGAAVEVFLAVPFPGRAPDGLAVLGQVELGDLRSDADRLQRGLVREFVAEAQAVVIQAEHHVHAALQAGGLGVADAPFVVMVADEAALAPRLLPGLVHGHGLAGGDRQAALQRRGVGQQEAQLRRRDHHPPLTQDGVHRPAVVVGEGLDRQDAAGRAGAGVGRRGLGANARRAEGQNRGAAEGQEGSALHHVNSVTPPLANRCERWLKCLQKNLQSEQAVLGTRDLEPQDHST